MAAIYQPVFDQSIERAKYFQSIHAWPLNDKLNYSGWLDNFKSKDELNIACQILDFFTYYSSTLMDSLLRSSLGNCGRYFSSQIPSWKHRDFKTKCLYSFIPGENPNPTDSGPIFTRKLKEILGIDESQIIYYDQIMDKLDTKPSPTPVILVDDFVGSGAQCDKAWNKNIFLRHRMTLKQYSNKTGHLFAYAPLIVNRIGRNRIKAECDGLFLSPAHVLGNEYNLFHPNCICWKKDSALFDDGVKLIVEISERFGIPDTDGTDPVDIRGFGKQGLAIGFENGPPDAVPAFFYWCDNGWTPLMKRHYIR